MNTILSIDLDIIFSPYIGIYNTLVNSNQTNEIIWKSIATAYNINDFIPNEDYLQLIINLINKYSKQVNKIYIGLDHSCILEAIQLEKEKLKYPYKLTIHNIDYHHDIFYGEEQAFKLKRYNTASCSNWVGFLTINNFIQYYYWYYGQGSCYNQKMLEQECYEAIPQMIVSPFKNINTNLNIDILFISISSDWIPPQYYNMIKEIILDIPVEKRYYIKYPYFIGNEEKDFLTLHRDSSFNYFNNLLENCMD